MEYTAQNLEYAVSVFYNGEQEGRAQAHAWLTVAQRVPQAWNFVWELLQPNKGTEIQFYAATTLHTKILRCWNEVPPESYTELKEKILQSVIAYSKGPKIVTNRLCISLAAFILQQGSADVAEILRPLSTAENTSLLLEVLTVIPEEYTSMTMGSAMRSKNRAALNQASGMVLDDMLRYLETVYNDYNTASPSEETVHAWTCAANCVASWLTLDGQDRLDSATTPPQRALLCRALLTVVRVLCRWNEAMSDTALEACEACLSAVRAAGTVDWGRDPGAESALIADLAALGEPLLEANNQPNSLNEELLSAVITCCVAVSECHARRLVEAVNNPEREHSEGVLRMLQLLLTSQLAPGHYPIHETRSNLIFGLWYSLQDEIFNILESTDKIHPQWHNYFAQLLLTLVKKSEMPSESALSKDDQELLRCYRQDIADIVMYCFGIVGEWCWTYVESAFTAAESALQRESALHVFLALADAAPSNRAPPAIVALLHHALELVADTENQDTRVLHTALDCLGGYAAWLSSVQSPQTAALGQRCMRAAGTALLRCPAPAALALRKLCVNCSVPAAELVADIVQVAQSGSGTADAWTRRQLLSAAGAALTACNPDDAEPLLTSLAHGLRQNLNTQVRSGGKCGAAECVSLMGALSQRPALACILFRELLPALTLMPSKPELVQPMFQIVKNTVSALMGECTSIGEDLEKLIIAGFETAPCPAGLDVIKLVTVFTVGEWEGASRVVRAGVMASARAVSPVNSASAVIAAPACPVPDLAEALFAVLTALTQKQPIAIDWIEDLLPDLVDLACTCVRLWEVGPAGAACRWLATLAQRRASTLQGQAPSLTHTVLRCIGGATPRNQMEPLAELLLALNRAQWAGGGLGAWLREALAHAGFPTPHATEAHKQKFITAVLKERTRRVRLLEAVQEFSLVCRGLIGTEYARQSISYKQMVS
ncbi:jg8826 [Pararge aegeria aegeria]|uniref:Jg8826 protein n=4 Tax=Pararge aegeria TaxID=116150 RepID=A0A8S4SM66_9NEOP|nr:jg8826 [Pararge aegeria aegeria]